MTTDHLSVQDADPGSQPAPGPAANTRRRPSTWLRVAALVAVAAASVAAAAFIAEPAVAPPNDAGSAMDLPAEATTAPIPAQWQRAAVTADQLASEVGVRLKALAVTGSGGLLDLRLIVLDADKANALHDQSNPLAIVDEATGIVASDLLMSHAHSEPFKAGLTYYWVFENPGSVIRQGSVVSVLLGTTEIDHVAVQ